MGRQQESVEQGSRRSSAVVNAWCLYDWANSAFVTTVMAGMFPPFYRAVAVEAGAAGNEATAMWAYTTAAALLVIAVSGPLLGAIADYTGGRKRYIAAFVGLGVLCTAGMVFIGHGQWLLASLLFIGASIGFAGAEVFYESLLPHITTSENIDQVSTKGYALGYIGGGTLLIVNLAWYMKPAWFFMPDQAFALRASFVSVAVWWAVFSVPLFLYVPEPPAQRDTPGQGTLAKTPSTRSKANNECLRVLCGSARCTFAAIVVGFGRLVRTLRELRRYRYLLLFLVAFWLYNDGIGTVIKMAIAYGDEIGLQLKHMVAALVITQFVGIPFAFLFGALARRLGAKKCILLGLAGYVLICVGGYFMRTEFHFYMLAFAVGMMQGGTQALSRSFFGRMVPEEKSAEFFGFFGTSSKFAGIFGPVVFGIVSQTAGGSRLSILAVAGFFVAGGALLTFVRPENPESTPNQQPVTSDQ